MCDACNGNPPTDRDREEARQLLGASLAQAVQIRSRIDVLVSQLRGHERRLGEVLYRAELARIALGLDRGPDPRD